MQHQPDHDQPRFGDFGDTHPEPFIGAQRLSILALLSTITGALTLVACCVPAVGIVPTLLGAGGLIGISRSRGEVRGRGLAITGLLLGLFSLAVSTALWVGASSVAGQFGPVYSQAFDPDPQVVRSVLTNRAAADLTDEQVAAFQQALAEAGATGVEIPEGLLAMVRSFASVGREPTGYESLRDPSEGNLVPMPARTDGGWTYVLVLMSRDQAIGAGVPALADAAVWPAGADPIWLIGPATPAGQSPETPETDTQSDPGPSDGPGGDPGPDPGD